MLFISDSYEIEAGSVHKAMHRGLAHALRMAAIRHERIAMGEEALPVPSDFEVTYKIEGWDLSVRLEERYLERLDGAGNQGSGEAGEVT